MKDPYKVKIITEAIESMKSDDYCLTRLWNENGHAINLNIEIMEVIKAYYEGKTIVIKED